MNTNAGANTSGNASRPARKRWAWAVAVLAVLLLAAVAYWWWLHSREAQANEQQRARLLAAVERQRALAQELAQIKPNDPTECPPGQVLRRIDAAPAVMPGASAPSPVSESPKPPTAPTTGEATALAGPALALRLEQATAMVLVAGQNSRGYGTGFFIAPNLLVTNRHVVEDSAGKRIFITSKALGSLRRATVLRATPSSTPGSPDLALLRMDDGTAVGVLALTPDVAKLSNVTAAGYPAVVVEQDANFQRLLRGDLSAAPDLNLTQGGVQSLQTGAGNTPLIVHTAFIAQGNSGGPLVDSCGRVVGVNTYLSSDPRRESIHVRYAISTRAVSSFLESAVASAAADGRPCATKG